MQSPSPPLNPSSHLLTVPDISYRSQHPFTSICVQHPTLCAASLPLHLALPYLTYHQVPTAVARHRGQSHLKFIHLHVGHRSPSIPHAQPDLSQTLALRLSLFTKPERAFPLTDPWVADMASGSPNSMALRQSVEVPDNGTFTHSNFTTSHDISSAESMAVEHARQPKEAGERPSKDNCDGEHGGPDATIAISSSSRIAGQTVAPFLAKHIPESYAPMGVAQPNTTSKKDPNTKFCYRHQPDSKCRRTADEPTMENLQRVYVTLVFCRSWLTE